MLQDITILDFTRLLPGPLATQLLAGMGARVIKIEHPEKGDYARIQPPFVDGESTLFRILNQEKEIRKIDFLSEEGKAEIIALIKEADLLIEPFRPGIMKELELGYEDLRRHNERLIYVSLSGYGQDGPYRDLAGHDLNYLAYSGILGLIRDEQGRPVIPGVQIADIAGGSYMTFAACLAALYHREHSGRGCYVDVNMLDGLMPLLAVPASQHWGGIRPETLPFLSGALVNYNVYECADSRWVALGALEIKFWRNFCELVEKPEWVRQHHWELAVQIFPKAEVEALFKTKTQAEWVALAEGKDICLSPVQNLEEVDEDAHIQNRGVWRKEKMGFGTPFIIW